MHMEKTQMCVGWICPWTEISTSPDDSGELGNLSIHICGASGSKISDNLFRGCSFENPCLSLWRNRRR